MMTAHADDDFDWLFMNLTSTSTTPHTADDILSPACSSIMNIDTPDSAMLNYFDGFPALDELNRSNLDLEAASNSFTKPSEFSAIDETMLTELLQFLDTNTALNAFAQTPSPALSVISEMDFDFFSADFPLFDTSSSPQTMSPQTPQTPQTPQMQFADSQIETLFTAAADKSNKVLPKARSTTAPKCGKAAVVQQQHERLHHSFKCHFEGCTKVYAHNRNLTAHIRLDHTESSKGVNGSTQPFHCKVCNAGFRYSQTRNRHERNFHPKLT
ncbi:hypothetical protein BJ741DRAFT_365849 [Chytriomyces cf. hyalinus JEL632]|nr:hypothetical protein BJ741DRAFT_365849 [Chytriomyces cf. hyalinus JEL632]